MKTIVDYTTKLKSYFQKKPTITTQTLTAGNTSVTFTDLPTTGNFLIDFYSSNGVGFIDIDLSTAGSATLTYPQQSADIQIICEIKGV